MKYHGFLVIVEIIFVGYVSYKNDSISLDIIHYWFFESCFVICEIVLLYYFSN